jgi:hypothetical protein
MSRNRQSIGHAAVVGFLQKEMLQPLHHSHRVNRNCLNLGYFTSGMPLASTLSQSRGCAPTDNLLVSARSSDVGLWPIASFRCLTAIWLLSVKSGHRMASNDGELGRKMTQLGHRRATLL